MRLSEVESMLRSLQLGDVDDGATAGGGKKKGLFSRFGGSQKKSADNEAVLSSSSESSWLDDERFKHCVQVCC